jgi:hypothetical protein
MKPGSKDKKLEILITGEELSELKRYSWQMVEAFGLDKRIDKYQGMRPIGLYSWDFDCILAVVEGVLNNAKEYPDKGHQRYIALKKLYERLKMEQTKFN